MPVILIVILITSSFTISSNANNKNNDLILKKEIFFSDFEKIEKNSYTILNTYEKSDLDILSNSGEPMLPVLTKIYTFPLNTRFSDISFDISEVKIEKIDYKIKPAPQLISKRIMQESIEYKNNFEKESIYENNQLYPKTWYDYDITAGREEKNRVLFLTIRAYPVRYNPKENILHKISSIKFNINYNTKNTEDTTDEAYDLLIISPKKFKNPLNRLVEHKNSHNLKTRLITTDYIYDYFSGRDDAEKIKYCIKDALDNSNITYVLLVGGRDGQKDAWNLPTRTSNLDDGNSWNDVYVTDLYFSDIYKYNNITKKLEFDDWDSNGNEIFAEWYYRNESTDSSTNMVLYKDVLDLKPDVNLGRLACRNILEVKNVVDKIISYENQVFGSDWLKKAIMVGGDTFPPYTEFIWDTSKVANGLYSIEIQSLLGREVNSTHEKLSSEIKEVLVFVLNSKENKTNISKDLKIFESIKNKNNISDFSSDIYIELISPSNFQFLTGNATIDYITNDKVPPRSPITVNLTIRDINDKIVLKKSVLIKDHFFEGEIISDKVAGFLEGIDYDFVKLYASKETLNDASDVNKEIKNGAIFIFLTGHSTPREWTTHPVYSKKPWIDLYQYQMQFLNNGNKLPICVVDGCHPSQFDVSLSNFVNGIKKYGLKFFLWDRGIECFGKWTWISNCWSWNLVKQRNGGFIASIGNTGLGYGSSGEGCIDSSGTYLPTHFFEVLKNLSQNQTYKLGDIHSMTINDQIDEYNPNDSYDPTLRKYSEQWVLLGDPSLKIGGYP